jgi:hypothetical protein
VKSAAVIGTFGIGFAAVVVGVVTELELFELLLHPARATPATAAAMMNFRAIKAIPF